MPHLPVLVVSVLFYSQLSKQGLHRTQSIPEGEPLSAAKRNLFTQNANKVPRGELSEEQYSALLRAEEMRAERKAQSLYVLCCALCCCVWHRLQLPRYPTGSRKKVSLWTTRLAGSAPRCGTSTCCTRRAT